MKLEKYNLNWKKYFKKEERTIRKILGKMVVNIHHIGSTAIVGIKSKPIIDIAILIKSYDKADDFIKKIEQIGYNYSKKRSSSERYFFTKGDPVVFHLSLVNPNTLYLQRQLLFRDYLISHKEQAKEYEDIKGHLIKKYPSGREKYCDGKGKFVNKIIFLANKK